MVVLDYSNRLPTRHLNWRLLLISTMCGALAGFFLSIVAYEPQLYLLTRGVKLAFFEINEPHAYWIRFARMLSLSGAIVGSAAAINANSSRRLLANLAAFAGIFIVGTAGGLVDARSRWNPVGYGQVWVGVAPILTAPKAGCASVLMALVVMVAVRHLTRPSNAFTPPSPDKSPSPIPGD